MINTLILYNYTGSLTHTHQRVLNLSGGILVYFPVITASVKQTSSKKNKHSTDEGQMTEGREDEETKMIVDGCGGAGESSEVELRGGI